MAFVFFLDIVLWDHVQFDFIESNANKHFLLRAFICCIKKKQKKKHFAPNEKHSLLCTLVTDRCIQCRQLHWLDSLGFFSFLFFTLQCATISVDVQVVYDLPSMSKLVALICNSADDCNNSFHCCSSKLNSESEQSVL